MLYLYSVSASLSGQVIWITGASSGIGEELAYVLAAAGSKLVLSARRQSELQRVKQRCVGMVVGLFEGVWEVPFMLLGPFCTFFFLCVQIYPNPELTLNAPSQLDFLSFFYLSFFSSPLQRVLRCQ